MDNEHRLIPLSEVLDRPIQWLWQDRIALRSLTCLEGDPGGAKTTIALDLAARLTTGRPMPGSTTALGSAGVVFVGSEDDPSVIKSRLVAAGADLARIKIYDRLQFGAFPLVLPDDLVAIEVAASEVYARLLIIDPISGFLAGSPNNEQVIRHTMNQILSMAERLGLAVVFLRHLTKSGSKSLYRGMGWHDGRLCRKAIAATSDHDERAEKNDCVLEHDSDRVARRLTNSF